jgi:hypothetical protein
MPDKPARQLEAAAGSKPIRRGSALVISLTASIVLAGCQSVIDQYTRPLAPTLPATPTLDDVAWAVNSNTARIRSVTAHSGRIIVPGYPDLKCDLNFEAPRRLRLRGSLMGQEVDVGSNDELFWYWLRREKPPVIYYCRHEDFATSTARSLVPFEPDRLVEALGLVTVDPGDRHEGPYQTADGRFEIRTFQGNAVRVLLLEPARGWVLEEHLFNQAGQPTVSARLSRHRRDPLNDCVLPRTIHLEWPAMQLAMTLELEDVEINLPPENPEALWTMPRPARYTPVDLGRQPEGLAGE